MPPNGNRLTRRKRRHAVQKLLTFSTATPLMGISSALSNSSGSWVSMIALQRKSVPTKPTAYPSSSPYLSYRDTRRLTPKLCSNKTKTHWLGSPQKLSSESVSRCLSQRPRNGIFQARSSMRARNLSAPPSTTLKGLRRSARLSF